jgi:hypothetical protein
MAFNPDGTRIASFGSGNGLWAFANTTTSDYSGTAIVSDGANGAWVAIAGVITPNSTLVHLDGAGAIAKSQGVSAVINSLAADAVGNVYLGGQGPGDAGGTMPFLAHFQPNGNFDPAFPGAFGIKTLVAPFTMGSTFFDNDGGLVLAGNGGPSGYSAILGHVAANGTSLIDGGPAIAPNTVTHNIGFQRAKIQTDSNVVAIGNGNSSTTSFSYVQRVTLAAQADPSFADGGMVLNLNKGNFNDVALDSVGRIVVVGGGQAQNGWNITRYWP